MLKLEPPLSHQKAIHMVRSASKATAGRGVCHHGAMAGVEFGPGEDARFGAWRDGLVSDFERFIGPRGSTVDASDLGLLLDWKRSYGDGRLGRWRRVEIEQFLLDWCPAKLSATAQQVQTLPAAVALAMRFLADRGLLEPGSDRVDQLSAHPTGLQAAFMAEMDNPVNFGMAKSLFGGLDLDVDDLTPESLDAAMARFNGLPEGERRALTGGASSEFSLADVVVGPITLPDEETLRSSALNSPALEAFVRLADYFAAPGRPLTKTGNLKLADARALVDLLGTGDVFREPGADGWRGSTRSASELPTLDHWKGWASEVGVLRQRQGRLVAVEAWRKRVRKDPLNEVLRALDLLADAGPLRSYRWWFPDQLITALDSSLGPLLGRLATSPGGVGYDDVLQEWQSMIQMMGVREWYPGKVEGDFSLLIDILERIGVVVHREAEAPAALTETHVRRGGTVVLTPVGLRFGADLLSNQGVTVQVMPEPHAQTVEGLVRLAADVDAELWWGTTLRWLDVQVNQSAALEELLAALERASDPALLLSSLEAAPNEAVSRLVPVMRRLALAGDPAPGDLPALAAEWLHRHGRLRVGEIEEDVLVASTVVVLARLAGSAPELVIEAFTGDQTRDPYGLVQLIGQLVPPHAVELLEIIGSRHPDKVVAKAARKQLFRTRSRLLQLRSRGSDS